MQDYTPFVLKRRMNEGTIPNVLEDLLPERRRFSEVFGSGAFKVC